MGVSAGTVGLEPAIRKAVVVDKVCATIEREYRMERVNTETPLDSLELDSLEFMEMLLAVREATGMDVPDSKIGDLHTVGDIVEALC